MYGTIFRMKTIPGQQSNAISHFKKRSAQDIEGAIAVYLLQPETQNPETQNNELVGVVIFEDKAAYIANANDSVQHEIFTKLRSCLSEDPEWTDGEYI